MALGEKLKTLRLSRNLTQEHLSSELGITQKTYSNFENNKTQPNFEQIEKIAQILEVSILDFLTDDKIAFSQNTERGSNNGIVVFQQLPEKLIEQYELRIKQLENDNKFLKDMLNAFTNKG